MKLKKTLLFFAIVICFAGTIKNAYPQSDSLYWKEMDLKRIGLNFFNFSKPDKFNFEVVVIGGVKNPGMYLLAEGTSLIELVALTGGTNYESSFENFKLVRAKAKNPELKSDTVFVFNYTDFFDKEKVGNYSKQNPLLKPGDILLFPIRPDKDFWDIAQKVATILVIPLISIATLIVTIMNYNK